MFVTLQYSIYNISTVLYLFPFPVSQELSERTAKKGVSDYGPSLIWKKMAKKRVSEKGPC